MLPVTFSTVTASFLTDRPFLLLDVSAFDTRFVGSLLAKGAIKSKGGISLPPEIWLQIFKLLRRKPHYHLARALTAASQGDETTLSCEVELTALTFDVVDLVSMDEVKAIDKYLDAPDGKHDLSFLEEKEKHPDRPSPPSKFFSVTVTDSDDPDYKSFLPHCLYHRISVPDIIAHLQDNVCTICLDEDMHRICPGCTGEKFDAFIFMGCGVSLACPLCLGLDFMYRAKNLLQTYYLDGLPEDEENAQNQRHKARLDELGYH